MKVLFVVTHLLGSGHLSRTLTLARAFGSAGHEAVVVSGGMPVPHLSTEGVRLIQLPPLRSEGADFSRLLDQSGALVTPEFRAARQQKLVAVLEQEAPQVMVTELFPFGRRVLKEEFIALLEAAQAQPQRPLVLASIRDILAPPSKPKKAAFAQDMIDTYYDAVLVHADPDITPLMLSWPVTAALEAKLRYTGFVAPAPAGTHPDQAGKDEIIVSAGGGDVGQALFACAKAAAGADGSRQWRLLVGGGNAAAQIATLRDGAPHNLTVETARPDFRQMLNHAAASVSMCGYNTAQDILQTSCPAVFVPFDAGQEVEQGIRATALGALDGIEVLTTAKMTPATLLRALDAAVAAPSRRSIQSANGAAQSVQTVEALWKGRA